MATNVHVIHALHASDYPPGKRPKQHSGFYINDEGIRVTYFYTTDRHFTECRHCRNGVCEQRVEESGDWESIFVIHGRPRHLH